MSTEPTPPRPGWLTFAVGIMIATACIEPRPPTDMFSAAPPPSSVGTNAFDRLIR